MERNYVSVTLCIPKFLHNPRNLPRLFPKLVFFGYSAEAAERAVSGRRNGSRWNAINSGAFDSLARQHCLRASRVPSAHSSIANATHRGPRNEHSNFTGVVTFRLLLAAPRDGSVLVWEENSLSLIVSDLPVNCRACLQRLTDSKTLLFVILRSVLV